MKNISDVVLRGVDLGAVGDSGDHRFTSANTSIKKGVIEVENGVGFAHDVPALEIPCVATFKFGKPRLARKG